MEDNKMKAIELILKGNTIADTARIVGVNRKTIYNWLDKEDFKAELDRQATVIKDGVDKRLLNNIEPLLDKLIKIALKSNSEKTSLDACIYALNRLLGTPTSKIEQSNKDSKDNTEDERRKSVEDLLLELDNKDKADNKEKAYVN